VVRMGPGAMLTILALVLTWPAGCQRTNATGPNAATPAGPTEEAAQPSSTATTLAANQATEAVATGQKVKVKGYINVASGCQQPTVDLLKRMAHESDRMELELIDFGSEEGNRRWRADGYHCMTITIDGHQTVTYGQPGHRRIVTFTYPPGFQWVLSDLEAAIKDALAGKLYYGEEPGATKIESRMPTLRLTARAATLNGKSVGEVLVNGQAAIRMRTSYDGLPPLQRAEQAASRLRKAISPQFKPADIKIGELSGDRIALAIGDKIICIADEPQAKMLKLSTKRLAMSWAASLKKALMAAMSPADE
jgi:hypothetical protein